MILSLVHHWATFDKYWLLQTNNTSTKDAVLEMLWPSHAAITIWPSSNLVKILTFSLFFCFLHISFEDKMFTCSVSGHNMPYYMAPWVYSQWTSVLHLNNIIFRFSAGVMTFCTSLSSCAFSLCYFILLHNLWTSLVSFLSVITNIYIYIYIPVERHSKKH